VDTERYRLGDPFLIPKDPDELELLIGWFWDRIRVIISVENMHMKFHSPEQVIAILERASLIRNVNLSYEWLDGQWNIMSNPEITYLGATVRPATCKEDVLNLPVVGRKFSRIYRFKAKHFITGDKMDLKELEVEK